MFTRLAKLDTVQIEQAVKKSKGAKSAIKKARKKLRKALKTSSFNVMQCALGMASVSLTKAVHIASRETYYASA